MTMSNPFIGEIRMFGAAFAPVGWALCQGQPMAVSQNQLLFDLIGTTYGGNGTEIFNVPDLQGRAPVHQGQGISQQYVVGQEGGAETVTVTTQQLPVHNHSFAVSTNAPNNPSPANAIYATAESATLWFAGAPDASLNAGSVQMQGGSQSHPNMQPFVVISFIISLAGIYPQS